MASSMVGSISKLFNAKTQKSQNFRQVEEDCEAIDENIDNVVDVEEIENEGIDVDEIENEGINVDVIDDEEMNNEEHVNEEINDESILDFDKDVDVNHDPGLWDTMSDTKRTIIVQRSPIKISKVNDKFLSVVKDGRNRSFSSKHYIRRFPNGEEHERKWLVYSNALNKVFCFCCKLFKNKVMLSKLSEDGIDDWHNLPSKLREHETNLEHCENVVKWVDLQKGLNLKATVDKNMQAQIDKEKDRWKMILIRIIEVVKTLSQNSLPFRGSNEKIYKKNNGLFCQLIEFLAEFDPIMKDHLRRVMNKEIQHHYLSHKIQNEIIILLSNEIKTKIIEKISKAKYFSVMLDCTPDIGHEEQMSIIIRCVDIEDFNEVKVKEFFLGFIVVDDTSGLGLFKQLESILNELKLNIDDIRGQGYDNGSNMKGKHQGVQKRLLDKNPRAFYMPCRCHSLNLALCDMAKSCVKARNFFAYVQKIYTLFSGSTHRWDVLKKYVKGLTLKSLSVTRWESHVESVRAIRFQAPMLRDALVEIAKNSKEDIVMAEAKGLCLNVLENFEFLISLCIWFKLLDKVNQVSKILQHEDMNLEDAIIKLKELILFFQSFREYGFEEMMKEAKELAIDVNIEPMFEVKRVSRRKRHFDEDLEINGEEGQSSEENFRVTYFVHIIDQALTSLKDRFEQFELYVKIFGFLLDAKFMHISKDELMEHCICLEGYLKHNKQCDIYGKDLFQDLRALQSMLPKEITKSVDILDFIKSYVDDGGFQCAWIAYRILLTIPVTVASAERIFSKLKLIKNYLQTTMSQERLNGLAMISIEREFLEKLDCDNLIEEFATKNAR